MIILLQVRKIYLKKKKYLFKSFKNNKIGLLYLYIIIFILLFKPKVDIWSAGLIFSELILRKPLVMGLT
jgi:hypothetical protein